MQINMLSGCPLVPRTSFSSFNFLGRMTGLALPAALLVVTLCLLSDRVKPVRTIEILYPEKTFTPARGSFVKLSCDVHYDFGQCGLLHAVWYQHGTELTDPSKYFTTVNETIADDTSRRRQVVTEILDLKPEDSSSFQCKAACESGDSAMGHFIQIHFQD